MDAPATPSTKTVPPNLTLRAAPAPVTRFNRRILSLLLGLGLLSVFGALLYGLGFQHLRAPRTPDPYAANAPISEHLNDLPSSYAEIERPAAPPPQLGTSRPSPVPPVMAPPPSTALPSQPTGEDAANKAARLAAAREAEQARISKVFFATGASGRSSPRTDPPAAVANAGDAGVSDLGDARSRGGDPDENDQDHKRAFLQPPADRAIVSAQRVRRPASPYLVTAGSVIRAALLTAVNSDLPGLAEAQVTERVCDSVSGRYLLIPQGAKLVGEVDSKVAYGQQRLLAAWTQLKLPSGATLVLDRLPGAEPSGASGFSADTHYHSWRLAKGVVLSSLLGIGTELAADSGTRDNNRIIVGIRDSSNSALSQVGQRLTQKELNIQPTLTRAAGYSFAVLVAKDLVLRPLGRC